MQSLSAKEIEYINDILTWELFEYKKCFLYASQETNKMHNNVFSVIGNVHRKNYNKIIDTLDRLVKDEKDNRLCMRKA
ncbi:MAG: hypothetical protein WDA65_06450 [Christensenellales bacterium]